MMQYDAIAGSMIAIRCNVIPHDAMMRTIQRAVHLLARLLVPYVEQNVGLRRLVEGKLRDWWGFGVWGGVWWGGEMNY